MKLSKYQKSAIPPKKPTNVRFYGIRIRFEAIKFYSPCHLGWFPLIDDINPNLGPPKNSITHHNTVYSFVTPASITKLNQTSIKDQRNHLASRTNINSSAFVQLSIKRSPVLDLLLLFYILHNFFSHPLREPLQNQQLLVTISRTQETLTPQP